MLLAEAKVHVVLDRIRDELVGTAESPEDRTAVAAFRDIDQLASKEV